MVLNIGVQNNNAQISKIAFGSNKNEQKNAKTEDKYINDGLLLAKERDKHPLGLNVKIQANKMKNAFTKYPKKGITGSKNANFYEFLTMGMVPYLSGSAMLIAVFNYAAKYFNTEAAQKASKLGQKMGLGVLFYGIAKVLSKKLIELPVKWKHGIDVNLPYKKKINELPEEDNKNNLVSYEYHKAYESVDFPRWDLLYDNKYYGEERNAYFNKVAKKMKISSDNFNHADQKVKPKIKEKVIQTKLFSTLASYFWAATGVGIAMQKPWEEISLNPQKIIFDKKHYNQNFFKNFGKKFVESCKEFVNNPNKNTRIAGRALLGTAIGITLLGNFKTLFDFNKDRGTKTHAAVSLIDNSKEKVVC